MAITLLASLIIMAAYFLLLYGGVGFIQDKKFFSSAPKENLDAIPDKKPERFPGAHAVGWIICVTAILMFVGAFILAVFCNVMIYIGVEGYRSNPHELGKYLALFFGVCVFILCGFEHCVANMYYFTMGGAWSGRAVLYLLVMTVGNAAGGVIGPLARKVLSR